MQQTGFCVRYFVAHAPGKGRGVFAGEAIPKGAIIWRFRAGAFWVFDEASFTSALAKMSADEVVHELSHVFGMADFPGFLIKVLDDGVLINHADDPNVMTNLAGKQATGAAPQSRAVGIREVEHALLSERYALVTIRAIANGQEITNDYTADTEDPPFYLRLCEQYDVDDGYLDGE